MPSRIGKFNDFMQTSTNKDFVFVIINLLVDAIYTYIGSRVKL
jgi:hypothetical protein